MLEYLFFENYLELIEGSGIFYFPLYLLYAVGFMAAFAGVMHGSIWAWRKIEDFITSF